MRTEEELQAMLDNLKNAHFYKDNPYGRVSSLAAENVLEWVLGGELNPLTRALRYGRKLPKGESI